MKHLLKTESEYFQAAAAGLKNFEVRINDRNYQVGDTVVLQEVFGGVATGRALKIWLDEIKRQRGAKKRGRNAVNTQQTSLFQ